MKQVIVFAATKTQTEVIAKKLVQLGHRAVALHGDMNQRQRSATLEKLRKEQVRILVATDVAARGLDILTMTHIINFDLPRTVDDYVHRIGRTGKSWK